MSEHSHEIANLIIGMREAYARGENVMNWAKAHRSLESNSLQATLIAYDLQAGNYVTAVNSDPDYYQKWHLQLADILRPFIFSGNTLLEAGVG